MATSPNFSWPEPDNTDLVKNGALAIRTAINAIDTSMVDLKGGTTGQVLSKATNADMDFTWVTDATGIPATIFDAKGDIIAATAADTASRLAVGANDTVLTADSSTATGLKWATPAGGSSTFVGCAVFTTSNQSIPNSAYTAINFNSESIDTDSFHSTTTNTSRITIPSGKAGKYLITFHVMYDPSVTGSRSINVYKNGSILMGSGEVPGNAGSYVYNSGSFIAELAVADYLEFMIYQTSGGSLTVYCRDREKPFQVEYLGA